MEYTPFTLEEAEEIREDFEDLIDTDFKIGPSREMFVENVVVAPFPIGEKEHFTRRYFTTRNNKEALSEYAGADYDVVLITCEADNEANYSHIAIREFVLLRGIKYDFPTR